MRMRWGIAALAAVAIAVTAADPAWAQTPSTPAEAALSSQRISLDLKGVDILDVLKLLSQKSGLNFVAGKNLTGRVTIFVNDVDVWDVFELIVSANDLAYERRGNVVTVMMARDYELTNGEKFQERTKSAVWPLRYAKAAQISTVLNQMKSSVGKVIADEASNILILNDTPERLQQMGEILKSLDRQTETRVYNLNYAEAEKLQDKAHELLSPVGTITVDTRTNKVVVSDLKDVLRKTDQLVEAFDVPDSQVLIEAKIVKVDLTDKMDLGIDWQQIFSGDLATRSNFRPSPALDIVDGAGTGRGFGLKLFTAKDDQTRIILEALKKITKTDTLSNPRVMVSNNQEAKILVGKKEAIVTTTTTVPATGSTVSSPQIQYVDVGTKLYVTPNIKRNGYIQMKIRPEVSTSTVETFQSNRIPIVSSTEAETNVMVRSGVTVIIAGLIETKDDRTDQNIPKVSQIPFLGGLFRGSNDTKTKSELVVFLTPRIMLPDGSPFVPPDEPEPTIAGPALPQVILKEPVPAAYREQIRQQLQAQLVNQFREASLSTGSVVVSFVLGRDGLVVGEPTVSSPQGESFTQVARTALKEAEPFPRFPNEADADEVRFRLAVEYQP